LENEAEVKKMYDDMMTPKDWEQGAAQSLADMQAGGGPKATQQNGEMDMTSLLAQFKEFDSKSTTEGQTEGGNTSASNTSASAPDVAAMLEAMKGLGMGNLMDGGETETAQTSKESAQELKTRAHGRTRKHLTSTFKFAK
jgi:hypothetical protein